jgi:hypothetical protein
MSIEEIVRKTIKKLKEKFPGTETEKIEKELIPLKPGEEIKLLTKKRKSED